MPRWLSRQGAGLDDRRVLAAARRRPATAPRARRRTRAPAGPHGRDPAADRPRSARRLRLRGARRADALARLRRAPGRRRHALRGDHRRVRRRAAGRSTGSGSRRRFRDSVAAVSVGVVDGESLLDLDYSEDSTADVDLNVVMTGDGRLVEVQATAERDPFTPRRSSTSCSTSRRGGIERARRRRSVLRHRRAARVTTRRPLLAATRTSGASCGARCPAWTIELLDDRRRIPPETGATYLENARGKALHGRGPRPGRRVGARRGLRARGRRARRARRASQTARWAEGRHVERILEALAGDRRPARALRLRARRDRAGRPRAARDGDARGRDRRGAARQRGLRLRPGLRPGRRGADRGRARRRRGRRAQLAPRPRGRRRWRRSSASARGLPAASPCRLGQAGHVLDRRGRGAARAPPVVLGAEHDHVRHHVQPDEQDHRAAERALRRRVAREVQVDRQRLEGHLEHDRRRSAAPGSTSPERVLDVRQEVVDAEQEAEDGERRDDDRHGVRDHRVARRRPARAGRGRRSRTSRSTRPAKSSTSRPESSATAWNFPDRNGRFGRP